MKRWFTSRTKWSLVAKELAKDFSLVSYTMVQFDKNLLETPIMETCVLIPEDFSLKIDPSPPLGGILSPYSFWGNLIPSIINNSPFGPDHENGRRGPPIPLLETRVRVCSSKKLLPQTRYLPFSGTVRTDKLPLMPYLPTFDVSIATSK